MSFTVLVKKQIWVSWVGACDFESPEIVEEGEGVLIPLAVAIEYFNKTQNTRHSENCKHFNSLRFDYNLSHLQGTVVQRWVNANPGLKFNPLF